MKLSNLTFILIYEILFERLMKPKPDQLLHDKVDNLTTLVERLQIALREERAELARARAEIQNIQQRLEPVPVHATRVNTPPRASEVTSAQPPPARAARAAAYPNRHTRNYTSRNTRAEPPPARRATVQPREGPEFQVGDHIVVLNRHRGQQGRTAIVTRVFGNKVYFSIDGTPTYRWAHNVERLE